MRVEPDLYTIRIGLALEDVWRNVKRWNESENIGLTDFDHRGGGAICRAGNCAISAHTLHANATEMTLRPHRLFADHTARVMWEKLIEQWRRTPGVEVEEIRDERGYSLVAKETLASLDIQFADRPLTARAEEEFIEQFLERNPEGTQRDAKEKWKNYRRNVEANTAELRAMEKHGRVWTYEEEVKRFFANLETPQPAATPPTKEAEGEGQDDNSELVGDELDPLEAMSEQRIRERGERVTRKRLDIEKEKIQIERLGNVSPQIAAERLHMPIDTVKRRMGLKR